MTVNRAIAHNWKCNFMSFATQAINSQVPNEINLNGVEIFHLMASERQRILEDRATEYGEQISKLIQSEVDAAVAKVYKTLDSYIPDVNKAVDAAVRAERERFLEAICRRICPYCESGEYELHDERYHTKPGVSPTWENKKCYAVELREHAKAIRLSKPEKERA